MRINVDLLKCESNGLCMSQAPEVFEVDDDDVLHVLIAEPDESLRPKIAAAVKMCPKQALTLID
jgi:ferredoxin